MSTTLNNADKDLIKKIRNQMMIIVFLILIIIVLVFFSFLTNKQITTAAKEVKFIKEVGDKQAQDGIDNFRQTAFPSPISLCTGEYFDIGDITTYIKDKYPKIIERHRKFYGADLPSGLSWKLGFYWTVREDPATKKQKLGFYVIPTIVDTKTNEVYDYFKVEYNKFYKHPPNETTDLNVHDEGHLWP